jgi:hypothetical protein
MKVTSRGDSEDIRIYIDGILHIRLPRDKDVSLQSWVEGHSKKYLIEIHCKNHSNLIEYDNKKLWVDVLTQFEKII